MAHPPPPPPAPPGSDEGRGRSATEPTFDTAPTIAAAAPLTCPSCGATIVVRTFGRAATLACSRCGAVVDAADERTTLVQVHAEQTAIEPGIPLGSVGSLFGRRWQVIGYQIRQVVVEGEAYPWDEYLLFNPYAGYRYLVQYQGHFSFVTPLEVWPTPPAAGGLVVSGSGGPRLACEGRTYKHFQTATATTTYVLGEFPWRVRLGEQAETADYIDPPFMLSGERSASETTWSRGEYVEAAVVWKAFALPGSPPRPVGIYGNQSSPYAGRVAAIWKSALAAVALLVAVWVGVHAVSDDRRVFSGEYRFDGRPAATVPNSGDGASGSVAPPTAPGVVAGTPFVTEPFEIAGGGGVEVETAANVENGWIYVNYALINEATGDALDFGREVSLYRGTDSDGPWSEGSQLDTTLLPGVPAGRYYLRVEPESAAGTRPIDYRVVVRAGVASHVPFVFALLLLLLPPLWVALRAWSFEVRRWAESDHPMVQTEE